MRQMTATDTAYATASRPFMMAALCCCVVALGCLAAGFLSPHNSGSGFALAAGVVMIVATVLMFFGNRKGRVALRALGPQVPESR